MQAQILKCVSFMGAGGKRPLLRARKRDGVGRAIFRLPFIVFHGRPQFLSSGKTAFRLGKLEKRTRVSVYAPTTREWGPVASFFSVLIPIYPSRTYE